MRLKTPEKLQYDYSKTESPRIRSPAEMSHAGSRHGHGIVTSKSQMASSEDLWGRNHGDKPSEKIGSSTYRNEYPVYPLDNQHERKDREKYRENFGSLAERDIYRRGEDGFTSEDGRR